MVEVVEGAAAGCHEPDCVCEALVVAVAAQRGRVPLQHRGARLDTNPVVGEHRPAEQQNNNLCQCLIRSNFDCIVFIRALLSTHHPNIFLRARNHERVL